MPDPRQIAIENLAAVVDGRSLDAVLRVPHPKLSDADRAFAAELSYGLCRWYRQLHAIVAARLQKPLRERDRDIHFLMMLGAYQLLHADVAPHAAISTAVDLTRKWDKAWAGKLVNAILRGIQRESAQVDSPLQQQINGDLSIRFAQPKWLVKALQKAWPDQLEQILAALQQRGPMTLRVNTQRISLGDYQKQLQTMDLNAAPVAAAVDALALDKPVNVHQLPGFADGLVSVQDAGAQLAARLLDVQPGQRILDACAAPGGKTGHILELAEPLSVLAVDVDESRLTRVHENLERLQLSAEVLATDAAHPPGDWVADGFDRILLDAPCSATGVMRRHPDIRLLRRHADIAALAERQAELLAALWRCLRPGGKLLYATCSLMPQENAQVVMAFLAGQADAKAVPLPENFGHACEVGRQTLPGEQTMDGFYYALLEKVDG